MVQRIEGQVEVQTDHWHPLQPYTLLKSPIRSLPGSHLQYEARQQLILLNVSEGGRFSLTLELPDGEHAFTLRAERDGKETTLDGSVTIQRFPGSPVEIKPDSLPK
ncbi:hypothetical protein GCM10008938_29390 [Deinococcus roseus]|uniref:Uncharacterized protein n=2 Tax=Deinococcus roseus TaxID=392414 RepID=A0ABQ2D1E1_9DEIO|nr:hypothetical protein GCM10008938_29390 [Deinococcus roseus]